MRSAPDDLTSRSRIRDAAIELFGRDGFAATTVRSIAKASNTSPALLLHHFVSKDGLRTHCDGYVVETIRDLKRDGVISASQTELIAQLSAIPELQPLMRYLRRALQDGGPAAAEFFDQLVADAVIYMEEGVATGRLRPTRDPKMRALLLTTMAFGPILLGDHIGRTLGTNGYDAQAQRLALPVMLEIFTDGVFADRDLIDSLQAQLKEDQS